MKRVRKAGLGCGGLLLLVAVVLYLVCTGPRDLWRYPAHDTSPYLLPWPAGVERLCVQGNRGVVSHRGSEEFAYDFAMPEGSEVLAARGGTVVRVVAGHSRRGTDAPNNLIGIAHSDGTTGWYLHLRKGGAFVRVGQRVRRGEPIGSSGNVGRSLLPHLHFHVTGEEGETLPVSFADVAADAGIPRMGKSYRSGNARSE